MILNFIHIVFVAFLLIISPISNAVTKIDITRSNVSAVPIAIQTFSSDTSGGGDYYENSIHKVINNNLENCGLFKIIDQESYIETLNDLNKTPNFISWRQIKASVLILIDVQNIDENLSITFKIWDVFSQKPLIFKKLEGEAKLWRRIAHKISDEIYKRLTGENGYFDTKIAYVSVQGEGKNKTRKLAIMDQDGKNHSYLTNGDAIVLTPRFSQDTNHLLYFSYEDPLSPAVKLFHLNTNKSNLLRTFRGMSYAPRYAPDGKSILLVVEKRGISNIYLYNLKSMKIKQLTFCTSICTSPSFSPDQKKIVFNSDMGGGKHLYIMNTNNNSSKRISFNKGSYTSPVWSPKGNLIAFTKMLGKNDFYIGIMRPDGSNEKIIAHGQLVEGPAWAPNGRAIIFEKQIIGEDGYTHTKLYKIDIISRKEQELTTPHDATDAYWSNLLH
ncbi:MAG: Tol-Pal system protein TolB [Rickettsiales bacterium]|nr:Tol-Pal system protein TolB [Rickettsiales bacterium]